MQEANEVDLLRKFKKESGWSYDKISGLMGLSLQTIVNWIQGHATPSSMGRSAIRKFLADYSYKG